MKPSWVFAMAALGRTHAFIAGWALTRGYSRVVALNALAVALIFRVEFPELVMRGALHSVAGWTIYFAEVAICSRITEGVARAFGVAVRKNGVVYSLFGKRTKH